MEKPNKAELKRQYYLEYFEKNKDKLKEKIKCDVCGHEYMKYNKTSHLRTRKHKDGELLHTLTKDLAKAVEHISKFTEK
jgi:hypothetical protein